MEKAIVCTSWSLNWPPPEFEKAKRVALACWNGVKVCIQTAWTLFFVAPPGQDQIEESRVRARQHMTIF